MNDNLSYSPAGYALTKQFEGLRLEAYNDGTGVWTIGYGHTEGVKSGDVITKEGADELLRSDIRIAQNHVRNQINVPLTQGQFDALVDFAFNLGVGALFQSTLRRKLNAGDYAGSSEEFKRWNHAGGKVLEGLTLRRLAEEKMFRGEI